MYKYLILIAIIVWFIIYEITPSITTPSFYDDAQICSTMVNFLHNVPNDDSFLFLGKYFYLLSTATHGAMECYLLYPFLFFGGITLEAVRTGTIFWGVVILILVYYLGSMFFNTTVGILSTALLALNAYFLGCVKIADLYGFGIPIFMSVSLLFFLKWNKTKKDALFYLGMFFLGLGFNVKGWYLWFIISLALTSICLSIPAKKLKPRTAFIGLILVFLGMTPVLSVYLKGSFFKSNVIERIFVTPFGNNNLDVFANLSTRWRHLAFLLSGPEKMGGFLKMFPILFFWSCVVWLLYSIFFGKAAILSSKRVTFILCLTGIMFMLSVYSLTELSNTHLLILFPYIQMLIAIAVFEVVRRLKHRPARMIFFVLVLVLFAANIARCFEYHNELKTQKERTSSCDVSMLVDWISKTVPHDNICFAYYISWAIDFYGDLNIRRSFLDYRHGGRNRKLDPEAFSAELEEKIKDASVDDLFIFELNQDFREHDIFKSVVERNKKEIVVRKRFEWPYGKIRYIIYSLQKEE